MTTLEFLKRSEELLKKSKLEEPRLNAELILCEILKCNRMNLYLNFEKPLSEKEITLFENFLSRRISREPLQYIFGRADFYGNEFFVNTDVLIPRPETEQLTEVIISDIKKYKENHVSIFEIGSGSGCISITIAKILKDLKIDFEIFSIDNSQNAVDIALKNLNSILTDEKRVRFYKKDVFEIEKLTKNFDYIISNPPYISMEDFDSLEADVSLYEPKSALTDFADGYSYFRKIFMIASDKDFKGKVFCEIGYGQKEKLEQILNEYKFNNYSFYKDYSNIYRILEIQK